MGAHFVLLLGSLCCTFLANMFIISLINAKIHVLIHLILLIYLYYVNATSTPVSVLGNIKKTQPKWN